MIPQPLQAGKLRRTKTAAVAVNRFALCLVFATFLAACSSAAPQQTAQNQRIVALVPSLATDLFAIGAGDRVVGVSKFTDNIPAAAALPKVADFSSVDTERIIALHADRAIGIPSQAKLAAPLQRAGIPVTLIRDDTYDDIFTTINRLGDLTDRQAQAHALVGKLRAETATLQKQTASFKRKPSVFIILGTGPIWTAGRGSFIETLIERAGGTNAAHDLEQPWGQYSEEALLRAQPDALIAGPEVQLQTVIGREPWRSLHAVRNGHVFILKDRATVNALYQPGPNYNEGLHWLIERLTAIAR